MYNTRAWIGCLFPQTEGFLPMGEDFLPSSSFLLQPEGAGEKVALHGW